MFPTVHKGGKCRLLAAWLKSSLEVRPHARSRYRCIRVFIAVAWRGTVMAPFADQLTPEESWRIVDFLREKYRQLHRKWHTLTAPEIQITPQRRWKIMTQFLR